MAEAGKVVAEQITEEQAGEALHQLIAEARGETASAPEPVEVEQPAEAAQVAADTTTEETVEAATIAEPGADDIESLRKRLVETEEKVQAAEKSALARAEAIKHRSAQNESILREKYLRKSSVVDRALKLLKAARTEQGVPEAQVEQIITEIEGTMNPASASYSPPPAQPAATQEEQALILNSFLNERGMTSEEADEFGKWMRSEASTVMSPVEQAVAQRDLDGFLRIAHNRFAESLRDKGRQQQRQDAIGAVKAVQRTQREAARAASAAPAAPRKQTNAPKAATNLKDLSKDDLSALIRQSVEWAKQQ